MAESTLRQTRRGATHQNATTVNQALMRVLVAEPFYQHDRLGPGAELTVISGQSECNGYYDWAGRRLFMSDGEPDPMCPGAYRYQHNPECCDLEAPESDPRSPRYEPMHLRHKPGDTWIIDDNRPYDPYDPGPYGSPGWYKDERTGRHRRDETPDPLPAEGWVMPEGAWFPGTADWPEPEAPQHDSTRQRERGGDDRPPPWGRRGRPVPSEPDEPEGPQQSWTGRDSGQGEEQREARRFWSRGEPGSGPGDAGWISGYGSSWGDPADTRERGSRSGEDSGDREGRGDTDASGEFRFSKLREDAFDRFMVQSAQLRAAHFQPEKPYLRERAVWVLRWLMWVFALGLAPMPAPLHTGRGRVSSVAAQSIPQQSGPVLAAESSLGTAAESGYRPGAALAAAVAGARDARKLIADRAIRTSGDLADAVRASANRTGPIWAGADRTGSASRSGDGHWRARPRQDRPRPGPAFDTSATFILATGGVA